MPTVVTKAARALTSPVMLQFHPGVGVGLGNDYTLYALKEGIVAFKKSKYINSVSLQSFAHALANELSAEQGVAC